ncbi:MAG TPA: GAF domain-containing protein [Anaerolineae bacterium]|nr:GAF domain-containing protein [Anaerolineae bacterium]
MSKTNRWASFQLAQARRAVGASLKLAQRRAMEREQASILVIGEAASPTADLLRRAGYRLRRAERGSEGLRLAREERPDLVWVQAALPDMEGVEICRHIRAEPALADCPVILVGQSPLSPEERAEGLEAGANVYLTPPLSERETVAQVQALLRCRTDGPEKNHSRSQAILNALPDLMFVQSLDGAYLDYHAPEPLELYLPPEQFLGRKPQDVFPPEFAETVTDLIERVSAGGGIQGFEYQMSIAGQQRHYEARLVPYDQDKVLTIVRDITDRIQAEEALRQRNAQLETLHDIFLDISAHLNMPTLLRSIVQHAVELLDADTGAIYLYDEEKGKLVRSVAWGYSEKFIGVELAPGEGLAGKVFQSEQPMIVDDYRTWEGRSPVFEEEKPFSASLQVPLRWQDRIIGVLTIDADVERRTFGQEDIGIATLLANQAAIAIENSRLYQAARQEIMERKKAEDALARRAAQLALLNDIGQQISAELDLDSLLQRTTQLVQERFGYHHVALFLLDRKGAELVMRSLAGDFDRVPPQARRIPVEQGMVGWVARHGRPLLANDVSAEPHYVNLYPKRQPTRSELTVPIRTGDDVLGVLDVQSPHLDAFDDNDVTALEALSSQIAVAIENARLFAETQTAFRQLQEAQAQLVQSARLASIGELAAGVAHEINNPLTSVLGFAELAARKLPPDDPLQRELNIIITEAKRTRDIVRHLLEFSRQTKPLVEKTDLNLVLQQTLALIRSYIESSGIEIEERYAPNLSPIPLDVGQMKQVFLNLLTNAVQAMPHGGTLRIITARRKDHAVISIADTGEGIAPENLDRIFDPFFTTRPSGTGLGLSVSLGIVQQHGGHIEVTSQAGQGSTFTIWLPVERKA